MSKCNDLQCPVCDGHGVLAWRQRAPDAHPEPKTCPACVGRGALTLRELSFELRVSVWDIYPVVHGLPSRARALRVLDAIEKRFPEALRA